MKSFFTKLTLLLMDSKKSKWFLPLLFSLLLSSFLILTLIFTSNTLLTLTKHSPTLPPKPNFVESLSQLKISQISISPIPKIAYLISGSRGDGESLKRTLNALYHPYNQYVVHLDLEASISERLDLVKYVGNQPYFGRFGNVRVITRANLVTYRGPTMVTNTLHAASILLKEGGQWDWFINLSASDYPLVTQDDLLHTLSTIPRHLNFIEHTSDIGWKEWHRARPVIIDPGLYSLRKSDVYWVTQKRSMPTKFKLFTGSAWMMLSRPFMEYCLWGWDNLPRTLLMYYANFLSSPEGYFHTVICNANEFKNTTVNHDLHFISWDNPPKQHPHFLTEIDYQKMVDSNAPFARKFGRNETVLGKVDQLLGCDVDGFVPGGWLENLDETDSIALKPGPGADRIAKLFTDLVSENNVNTKQCV